MSEEYTIRLEDIEEYIGHEGKLPSRYSKDKAVASLGRFINLQKVIYKKKKYAMSEGDPRREMWVRRSWRGIHNYR